MDFVRDVISLSACLAMVVGSVGIGIVVIALVIDGDWLAAALGLLTVPVWMVGCHRVADHFA
jgi:hypothetical protein